MKKWEPEEINEMIYVPDELDKLTNYVAFQIRFHTMSDMPEGKAIAHIVWKAQQFFSENKHLLLTE